MAEAAGQASKLNVFISYSRDDLAFADQLDAALRLTGFGTSIDRHGISAGEDWPKRLGNLIRDADTIVFVLSPSSAKSKTCAWEVEEAVRLGKRVIPVLSRSLENASAPPQLAALNYIYFYDEPRFPGSGFGSGLVGLVSALNTDLDWLREHTRYLQRATEWDAGGRPANRLLSGPDIATAKAWAARRPKNAPEPTELQRDFIKASEAEDIRQQSAEAQRLQQVAEALAERQKAQEQEADARKSEAEAQKREAAEARRVVQRTQLGLAAAVVLTVVAVVFGLVAYQQRETALRQLDRANQALAESINNDLGFMPGEPFGPRQRQALWKLAFAAEPVKSNYVSILAKSPEETVRASPGFAQISRALGLLRPSAEEAQRLIVAVVDGLQSKPQDANPLVAELKALAPKAPVSQALELLLARIGKTTDPGALRALAEGLQALAAKLTEAQAAQALE